MNRLVGGCVDVGGLVGWLAGFPIGTSMVGCLEGVPLFEGWLLGCLAGLLAGSRRLSSALAGCGWL